MNASVKVHADLCRGFDDYNLFYRQRIPNKTRFLADTRDQQMLVSILKDNVEYLSAFWKY